MRITKVIHTKTTEKITLDYDHVANRKPKRIGNPNLAKVRPIKTRNGLIATMSPVPINDGFMIDAFLPKPELIKREDAIAMGLTRKRKL